MKIGKAKSTRSCPISSQISSELYSNPARSSRLMLRPTKKKPILVRKRKMMAPSEYTRASSCARKSKNKPRSANVIARVVINLKTSKLKIAVVPLLAKPGRRVRLVEVLKQKMRSS